MGWFTWLGRGAERDRAYARLNAIRQAYGDQGSRVIKLSARTELARKAAGSTQRAFEFVERAFLAATQEYARIAELLDGIEARLAKGQVGDLGGAESAVKGLTPKLDELERNLGTWEARWQQVPLEIDEADRALAELRHQVEAAAAAVGAPLPLTDRLTAMTQHLARTKATLAEGNPVEAGHLLEDLRIGMAKIGEQTSHYVSGAGAITQAESDMAAMRDRLAQLPEAPAEAVAALAAAEALLPRLRPALAAGRLEPFQADLLSLQRQLSAGRASAGH